MIRKTIAAAGLVLATILIAALPASAHVTVSGSGTQGGYSTFAFKVPNEEDAANTVQLEVQFPTDHPLVSVSVQPVPGWTARVEKTKLATPVQTDDGEVTEAVSTITWTGGEIKPGEFQQFPVSAGPLPDVDSLEFKAIQTYSNGDVVRWIDETPASGEEPEHPAPTLALTKAADDSHTTTTEAGGNAKVTAAQLPATVATTSDVDSAKTVGYIGIGVGVVGLVIGVVALVRKPRSTD